MIILIVMIMVITTNPGHDDGDGDSSDQGNLVEKRNHQKRAMRNLHPAPEFINIRYNWALWAIQKMIQIYTIFFKY